MSAHEVDYEPGGKMARQTVTVFEPSRRFVSSESSSGGQLHRREMPGPVLAQAMRNFDEILGDSCDIFGNTSCT